MVSINTEYRRTPQPQSTAYGSYGSAYAPSTDGNDADGHINLNQGGWSVPFMGASSRGYAPVSVAGGNHERGTGNAAPAAIRRIGRKESRMQSFKERHQYETIAEEESIGMSLISNPAPMGQEQRQHVGSSRETEDDNDIGPGIDISSFDAGPFANFQAAEARGHLTGGLGVGIKPEATIRGEDLMRISPTVERSPTTLGRSFTRKKSTLGRRNTMKMLAQKEANRRGEVVEVIMEEEDIATLPAAPASEVDLSVMTGPSTLDQPGKRAPAFSAPRKINSEVFYPHPNWKPFSMRAPYLSFIILLSVGLAVAQEVAYQSSPLFPFESPNQVPPGIYFATKFLPTIITVAYGVLWQFTDFEVRRLEAFYQLSKPGGALAAESINVDYITAFSFFRPIRALRLRHYAVAISSVATVISISLVPTLGAATISLYPDQSTRNEDPNGPKEIKIDPLWSRLLSTVFCLCGVMAMALFWLFHKRKTGLKNDVKGIAGLASMAVVSHILMDFKDLDVAPPKDIHARLKYHRYVLRNSSLAPDDENPVSRQEQEKYERIHLSDNPHPVMLRPAGAIPFIIWIVCFLIFIPLFLFTTTEIVTSNAPWVVTIIAVTIKLGWGSLDTDIRMMEPYYILSNRHASPKTLCLDYTALPFGWMPIRALLNGHWLVFFVGFGTVMAELLTILVTSLATVEGRAFIEILQPNKTKNSQGSNGDDIRMMNFFHRDNDSQPSIDAGIETISSFFTTLAVSIFILAYMAIIASIVFFRRRHPFLPRLPNTIASVLAFIHQSKMLYDFTGTEKLNNAQMAKRLESYKKTYGLGWFEGRDGQTHCGVDQEELSGNYRHGMNYGNINKPWVGNWDRWED